MNLKYKGQLGFVVTKDYTDSDDGSFIEVSVIGPRNCTIPESELLNGVAFKMFDDDDNLYYEGFLYGDETSEDGFSPLECYGTPNAGCTYIQYQNKNGKWETL